MQVTTYAFGLEVWSGREGRCFVGVVGETHARVERGIQEQAVVLDLSAEPESVRQFLELLSTPWGDRAAAWLERQGEATTGSSDS